MKLVKSLFKPRSKSKLGIVAAVVILFGVFGSVLLIVTHATTPAVSIEPEAGGITGNAKFSPDASASGSAAVTFGSTNTVPIRNINDKGVGFSLPANPLPTADQQLAYFADMRSLGATWVRLDIPWDYVQGTNTPTYKWGKYDTLINNATAAGLKVDGIVDFTPSWARGPNCPTQNFCPTDQPAAYGAFAATVVQHFGTKLGAVEIWNEPNIYQFWPPKPDVSAYVPMLKAAYTAIKAVDPGMMVISAGLASSFNDYTNHAYISQETYLQRLYTMGAQNYMDAVGYHPYSYSIPPDTYETYSAWSQINQTPTSMRSIMIANGDTNKRLWLTEYGAPTDGPEAVGATCDSFIFTGKRKVDQCLQARILSQAITDAKAASYIGPLMLYSYIDRGTGTNTQENFFGIIANDGVTHKQSYDAVKAAIAGN